MSRLDDLTDLETTLVKLCRDGLAAFNEMRERSGGELLVPDAGLVRLLLSTHKALCTSAPLLKDAVGADDGRSDEEVLFDLETMAVAYRERVRNKRSLELLKGEVDGSA